MNSSLSACQTYPNRATLPGMLHGCSGSMSKYPTLSLAWEEDDVSPESQSTAARWQQGEGAEHKPVMCKGKSGGTLQLLLLQYFPCPWHLGCTNAIRYQGNYVNQLKRKNISFFLQAFSSHWCKKCWVWSFSFFLSFPCKKSFTLCSCMLCHPSLFWVNEVGVRQPHQCSQDVWEYSALCKGKCSLFSILQMLGS